MQKEGRGRAQLSLDSPLAGALVALAVVAVSTLLLYPLRQIAAAESLGVVYLLGVLVVSIYCGVWPGLLTALGSVLAFNLFHIPPTGRLEVAKSEDWVALGVFLIAALLASSIAEQSRTRAREAEQRRQEADLMTGMATDLLGGGSPSETLGSAGERLARAVGLGWARIAIGDVEEGDAVALPLERDGSRIGTLLVPSNTGEATLERLRTRIVPALSPLVAAAVDRERLTTASVEARALRRSDELKTALLRAVSHDLRSPITAIRTAGEALESESLGEDDRRQLAASVSGEAERLADLVDKLLDLSRLEAGHAPPRRDWSSIEELVGVAVAGLGDAASAVKVTIAPDLPYVHADAAQLERAIANLLENAVRFADRGPALVRARAFDDRIVIRIVDSGPGIPDTDLDAVFQPFYRRPGADGSGSGLGLAIVRGFVELNGGRVWAESVPGRGTSFVIELPLEGEPATGAVPAKSA
jgi:two-component system, OmpR family, sensor histidine kinase KdpD